MRPFADNLWWPLGLAALFTASAFWLAAVLVGVGRGMWPKRRGAANASRGLLSPAGLVWGLQCGVLPSRERAVSSK